MSLIAAATLQAIGPAPLPKTTLVAPGGESIALDELPMQGGWLIVYVRAGCGPCASVLRAVGSDEPIAGRTVVIVGGAADDAVERMAADYPQLTASRWYADADDAFARSLDLQESPVIVGVDHRTMQWSLAGVISGKNRTRELMRSWIDAPPAR